MATLCVTKTSSETASTATATMADTTAAVISPRPLVVDGTIATKEKKPEFPRKFQVDLSKLVNEPIAKRVLVLVDEESPEVWPCLFFPGGYDAMLDELSVLHAEMVETDKTVDQDDFFDVGVLNLLSLNYSNAVVKQNIESENPYLTPVLVLLGTNEVMLEPPSTNLMQFFQGTKELVYDASKSPFLNVQFTKASKIIMHDTAKKCTGKRKRLLKPTRPLKKNCVTPGPVRNSTGVMKESVIATSKASMPVPAAAATTTSATVSVCATEEPSPGYAVSFSQAPKKTAAVSVATEEPRAMTISEASKKPASVEAVNKQAAAAKKPPSGQTAAAKEPTPMEIVTEVTAASKELEKLSNGGGLILVQAQAGLDKPFSTGNKNPLPMEEIRASQGGCKISELAALEEIKSPAQKSLAMDTQESEKEPAKKPANRADEQQEEPQPQVAAKKAVEKTTSNKTGDETETPEASLHSTCSELPQPGSGEMDDDRAIGLKQVIAAVEQSKETISGGRGRQVQPATKPPRVPERGRTIVRNSTQKKGNGSNIKKRSPSPARAPRLLTADERKIPTLQDVKPILEKAGYSFVAERSATPMYCFLTYNEKTPDSNVEGKDYTTSEEEFRKRLCSQGLGALAKETLTDEEEKAKVERWIRLAVVTSLPRAQKKLPGEIPDSRPSGTLRALGYNHNTHELPGLNNTKVTEENDVWMYLAHEGIPKECYFDKVETEDLLALELFLAFSKSHNLFEPPFQTRRGRRPSFTLTQSTAKKPATRQKPALKNMAVATSVPPKPNDEFVSPENCDKTALADCNRSTGSEASSTVGIGRNFNAEIDKSTDDDKMEKLETCLQKLERSATATDGKGIVLGPNGSHFRNNILETTRLLESMIKSRMDHTRHSRMKGQPAALFICGSPGIGKTTALNFCCQAELKKGFTDPDGIWESSEVEPVLVEVNCTQFATGGNVQGVVQQKLWEACNDSGTKYNEAGMKKMLTSTKRGDTKKRFVILVLDEIDQLINPNLDETGPPKSNGEKAIQNLSKWAAWSGNETLRFVVIGIGNTMNGPKYRRVKYFLKPKKSITFQAYDSTDLENIMRDRMEDASIVDPKALSFIAKKASSNNKGDARPAIELLATVLKDAKERVKNQAGTGGDKYIVKIRDVVKLNTEFTKLSKLIDDLSLHTKIVVSAAVELALKNNASGSEFMVTRAELLDACRKLFYEKLGENAGFDVAEANAHISTLDDIGIAKFDRMDDTIVFSHMPQELDTAVKESLGKDDFFGL